MSIQTISLNQLEFKIPRVIHAVQNDTGREIRMILEDSTVASGDTATLDFKRADDTYFSVTATAETSTNSFLADMTQALTCPGDTYCQLKVTRSGEVVGTFAFLIAVQEDASGTVTPQEGISLSEAVQRAESAADRAEENAGVEIYADGTTLVINTRLVNADEEEY